MYISGTTVDVPVHCCFFLYRMDVPAVEVQVPSPLTVRMVKTVNKHHGGTSTVFVHRIHRKDREVEGISVFL